MFVPFLHAASSLSLVEFLPRAMFHAQERIVVGNLSRSINQLHENLTAVKGDGCVQRLGMHFEAGEVLDFGPAAGPVCGRA